MTAGSLGSAERVSSPRLTLRHRWLGGDVVPKPAVQARADDRGTDDRRYWPDWLGVHVSVLVEASIATAAAACPAASGRRSELITARPHKLLRLLGFLMWFLDLTDGE